LAQSGAAVALINIRLLIKAEVFATRFAAPAQGSLGSKAADRCALITTVRHSEAAVLGTKRDTG
jgi:hypothetical protein